MFPKYFSSNPHTCQRANMTLGNNIVRRTFLRFLGFNRGLSYFADKFLEHSHNFLTCCYPKACLAKEVAQSPPIWSSFAGKCKSIDEVWGWPAA